MAFDDTRLGIGGAMKTAAYVRVSTDNQVGEDRYGMVSQKAEPVAV